MFSGFRTRIDNPLTEALHAITGEAPPAYTHGAFAASDLTESDMLDLQDWCCLNARPAWSTGIGVLEAAELIVREAIDNANIAGPENEDP
jgi:hypothetical protein